MTRTMIVLPCPGSSGVEQWIENPRVGGSIPPLGTIFYHNLLISLGFFEKRAGVGHGV